MEQYIASILIIFVISYMIFIFLVTNYYNSDIFDKTKMKEMLVIIFFSFIPLLILNIFVEIPSFLNAFLFFFIYFISYYFFYASDSFGDAMQGIDGGITNIITGSKNAANATGQASLYAANKTGQAVIYTGKTSLYAASETGKAINQGIELTQYAFQIIKKWIYDIFLAIYNIFLDFLNTIKQLIKHYVMIGQSNYVVYWILFIFAIVFAISTSLAIMFGGISN